MTGRAGPVAAVSVVFTAAGLAMASGVSRMPQIADQIGATPSELAIALVCVGIGSVVAMPYSGRLVHRFSTATVCRAAAVLALAGWSAVPLAHSVAGLAGVLLVTGAGVGVWDVAMNVQGTVVEKLHQRVLMPRWHGLFSVGAVVGALAGAGAAKLGIGIGQQLPIVAALLLVGVLISCGRFVPDAGLLNAAQSPATDAQSPARPPASPTSELTGPAAGLAPGAAAASAPGAAAASAAAMAGPPVPEGPSPSAPPAAGATPKPPASRSGITRTEVLLGLITFATALGEGAANDWLALALVDSRGAPAAVGALTYAGFNVTMAIGRFAGGPIIARHGRVTALRTGGLIASAGITLLCLVPGAGTAMIGAAAWGLGLAVVFPSAMSAAGEVPGRGGRAVATVSTIGYGGFLLGAPLIGVLAHLMPLVHALLAVAAVALIIVVLAPAARERTRPARERTHPARG